MKATIIKILPLTMSRKEGAFYRIEFMLENGDFAITDIVTRYKNYHRWAPIIKRGRGTSLDNLTLKSANKVDGDSYPVIISTPIPRKKLPGEDATQLKIV